MLRYSSLLQTQLDWTDQEILDRKKYLKWEELSLNFENVDLEWEDVFILLEVKGGGGSGRREEYPFKEYMDNNPWNQLKDKFGEEKTGKVVKIYCKVNGLDYDKILEDKKEIKITVNEFERFVESVLVKVNFK
jgi:hypothetical protein